MKDYNTQKRQDRISKAYHDYILENRPIPDELILALVKAEKK